MLEPFMVRALIAGLALALIAAPLGCFVVWQRMAYFGETVAQGGLVGVALGLALQMNLTLGVMLLAILIACLLIWFSHQKVVALDSILGLLHHAALAGGVIVISMIGGLPDLIGFLFGDVFAITREDLVWIFAGGAVVLAVVAFLWQPLLRLAVHDELAAAEGVDRERVRTVFTILLAITMAVAMKIVGILLVMAFLVVPAVAARPFAGTPERMVILTALIAAGSVFVGLWLSANVDSPGGPSIVIAMAAVAGLSLTVEALKRRR